MKIKKISVTFQLKEARDLSVNYLQFVDIHVNCSDSQLACGLWKCQLYTPDFSTVPESNICMAASISHVNS